MIKMFCSVEFIFHLLLGANTGGLLQCKGIRIDDTLPTSPALHAASESRYDFPQATFDKTKADVERLGKAGCPSNKIVLGLPFYGRDKDGKAKTFAQLAESSSFDADVSVVDGFAFNGPTLIARKVRLAKEKGLAGVMIWELAQDARGSKSLLTEMGAALRR